MIPEVLQKYWTVTLNRHHLVRRIAFFLSKSLTIEDTYPGCRYVLILIREFNDRLCQMPSLNRDRVFRCKHYL